MPTPHLGDQPGVVIVDDDTAVLAALKFALEIDGFAVRTFASGDGLLSKGIGPTDGCLVVDEVMPSGVGGLDLIGELRARGVDLPAILITTRPNADLRQRAAAAGVPIVEKPLIGSTLSDTIRSALRRRQH